MTHSEEEPHANADSEFIATQIELIRSIDRATRESAAQALYNFGAAAKSAVPVLWEALLAEPGACPWVGTLLVELGPSEEDIPKLRAALNSSNSHVRFWAARAAVKLGLKAQPLIPELIDLLCDSHHTVVDSVMWALGTIGTQSIPALIEAAKSTSAELRSKAVLALGRSSSEIELKLPTILEALNDADPQVRNSAGCAVCSLGQQYKNAKYSKSILDTLVRALERILVDSPPDFPSEWPQRVLNWLREELTH